MTNMATSTEKTEFTLTAEDRCDRCGARAAVRSVLPGEAGELLWCGHHWHEHGKAVREIEGVKVTDERDAIPA